MKEQVKAILYDFKNAGWTVQKVEQELKFSNGSLGKSISDFRYSKLLELHQKEIKKPVTVAKELREKITENNKPENKARIEAERNTAPNHIAATNPLDLEEVVDKEKEAIRLQLQEYEKELTVLGGSAVAQKRKRWVTDKIYDLKFKLNQ